MMSTNLNKNHFLSVRFSPDEKDKLSKMATNSQQTLSKLVRSIILEAINLPKYKSSSDRNRKIYFLLGKISTLIKEIEINNNDLKILEDLVNEARRELVELEHLIKEK